MCGATDGPRRTNFSAANVPGGPPFLPRTFRGGLVLGETNFCVTGSVSNPGYVVSNIYGTTHGRSEARMR